MSAVATELDELWSAVADPTRRRVLDILLDRGEATATVLAGQLPVTRQAVTKHLHVLAGAGVVRGTRRGREHVWELAPEQLAEARRLLDSISRDWDDALTRLKSFVEHAK